MEEVDASGYLALDNKCGNLGGLDPDKGKGWT